jgi:hypothetical protein
LGFAADSSRPITLQVAPAPNNVLAQAAGAVAAALEAAGE